MNLNPEKYNGYVITFWKYPNGSWVRATASRGEKLVRVVSAKTKEDAFDAIKRLLH